MQDVPFFSVHLVYLPPSLYICLSVFIHPVGTLIQSLYAAHKLCVIETRIDNCRQRDHCQVCVWGGGVLRWIEEVEVEVEVK